QPLPGGDRPMSAEHRRRGGTEGRRGARAAAPIIQKRYITRQIPVYELLTPEGLEILHETSMTILEEIGIDFRDAPALAAWKEAGGGGGGRGGPSRRRSGDGADRRGAEQIPPESPHPGTQCPNRRPQHGLPPDLRLALRTRFRKFPPLWHVGGPAQLREARLH